MILVEAPKSAALGDDKSIDLRSRLDWTPIRRAEYPVRDLAHRGNPAQIPEVAPAAGGSAVSFFKGLAGAVRSCLKDG